MTLFLAVVGVWTLLSLAVATLWALLHRTQRRDTRQRHPAGRIQPGADGLVSRVEPKRAPCGAWIGAESDDYWTRQFAEISHAVDCVTCQHETQGRAA